MSNTKRAHKLVAAVGAGAILAGGAAGLAAAQPAASTSKTRLRIHARTIAPVPGFRPETAPLQNAAINPRLRRSFLIFRERATLRIAAPASAETSNFEAWIPVILRYWRAGGAASILGRADYQNAEVVTTASRVPLLVLAGTRGACLAAPVLSGHTKASRRRSGGYVATCGSAGSVSMDGLGLQESGVSEMVGIVPDGNRRVMVTEASGRRISVPVTSDAFAISGSGTSQPFKVTFRTTTGAQALQEGER